MVIWYYNHYAGSSRSPKDGRSYYLTKSLKKCGHSPVVISASFHHLHKEKSQIPQRDPVVYDIIDGVPFVWFKTPNYLGNGLKRILNMLTYSFRVWQHDLVEELGLRSPDVIIISSVHPFHFFACLKWSKKYNAKLVFEVRDLWPLSLNLLLGLKKWHPLYILLALIERVGYRYSDLVISPLKNANLYMEAKGLRKNNFLYIPNGYINDFEWSRNSSLDKQLKVIRAKYKRVVMHTGSMGVPNGLELFVTAANEMSSNSSVAFVLIGKGQLEENLKKMSDSEHIYFFDAVPKREVLHLLSYSDACYCGSQNLPELYQYGVSPNKIFDYMLAKKAIVLAIDSPGNTVELSRGGICVKPDSITSMIHALKYICSITDAELQRFGEAGYNFLIKEHDFDKLALRLVERLETL
ncbi:Glycosyltransferase [Aequoribacter fuscus]|uniref:Glycosyltransferase n=1 Tax=Aequoribacter fuscus TaxID=2518989 RepID=F3L3Q7_9GAMM|nr:glycosyltransferase family 4 protein [Aequoribacter fuscus]EGG29030.1 Glycosyltransferase [Aequoribacter fuscus]QHJ88884.1 glycosyltransferase WbuB [Aequoribacter fuscus]